MNQAIQFPDREEWDDAAGAVCFPALVNGMQITCAIKGEILAKRFGGETSEHYLAVFREHRWDLEEEAEQLIRQQEEDDQGIVWLS
ncbi:MULTISPECIES: DUF1488 family protein [Kosakonia]|uniref:DUF1488 domain-containing protein n=1 Tax=Kosakonia pseudosacchari TaxID=1646340 RepID=A0ABX4IU41_9ENTR|nr:MULTISPECIES: DUF1488 domain-containing protein [Kosakonia]ANR79049.1 hypothetical protein BBB57_12780 [Kosakonia sacchari]PDO89380.1 DUF1488 domain-containing protein [Kosakonia pseudosacchari]QOV63673.1 DUF1488 domain-containing protein [Kosakonia pseudosacchari]WBU49783.1 DUF1488 domain-containing protein [Kosakonia pseudosacchari]